MATSTKYQIARRLMLLALLLLMAGLLRREQATAPTLRAAPAKGGVPLDPNAIASLALDENAAEVLALSDGQVSDLLQGKRYDFVSAVRLGQGEALSWRGCRGLRSGSERRCTSGR